MINVNLLPKYPCIIQQTDNENTQTYQVEAAILIKHQALITKLQGNVQLLEGRINNQILGVKGLMTDSEVIFQGEIRCIKSLLRVKGHLWLLF